MTSEKHKQGLKELEQYLLDWVYEYGNPFTEINYVFDSYEPLKVTENLTARGLYERAYPYHDEPLYDADGRMIGIQTVANREKSREKKPLMDAIREKLEIDIDRHTSEVRRLEKILEQCKEGTLNG